jgi:deoxyribodipyrimidine photo-lyase
MWNACQRQIVLDGWLPNVLRMYWAKQLLHWTRSPEEAYEIAITLNDRYFLDGRDANGYAQIAWCIGGRHDRPFPPERPISGLIRPMGINALRKRFDVEQYLAEAKKRFGL